MKDENHGIRVNGVWCLTMIFVILKLLGKITWSWVWVLSPIWISIIACITIIAILYIVVGIANLFDD